MPSTETTTFKQHNSAAHIMNTDAQHSPLLRAPMMPATCVPCPYLSTSASATSPATLLDGVTQEDPPTRFRSGCVPSIPLSTTPTATCWLAGKPAVLKTPAAALAASMRVIPAGICSDSAMGDLGRTGLGWPGVTGVVVVPPVAPGLPPVAVQMRVGRLRA